MALLLDARQRAMLEEMGVRVWLPDERANAARDRAAAPSSPAPPSAKTLRAPERSAVVAIAEASAPSRARESPDADAAAGPRLEPARAAVPASERAATIARMDWLELQRSVSGCRACALCESRRHTVFGVGQDAPVDWLVVGEAPGENEDLQGEPFVGAAGRLLDNMLKAVGLDRHGSGPKNRPKVFISNVLKCRPPGNRNPLPQEIAQCAPYLARQIELLEPRLILALGRFAVQALLHESIADVDKRPLGKLRGQVYRWRDVPVVVSYHPAYLLRSLPDKAKGWADLVLALQALEKTAARG